MKEITLNFEELESEVARLVGTLKRSPDGATLVTLSGELGAGKTAFAKAAAKALGVLGLVTSPTFILEKIYELPETAPFKNLVHIDAYRLESGKDLAALGLDEIMRNSGNLVLLEWPEKVLDALSKPAVKIRIETVSETERKLIYD